MDLALTYRCNNNCAHCYNARPRQQNELSTAEWKRILDKLWDIGVPHIVFTGGEPTLRDDLPELVAYAEKKGDGINENNRTDGPKAQVYKVVMKMILTAVLQPLNKTFDLPFPYPHYSGKYHIEDRNAEHQNRYR